MFSYGDNAKMALHTVNRLPTRGIPTGMCHIMEHSVIERLAGVYPGDYINDPHGVYMKMQKTIGVCMIDQYLSENPLTMEAYGYNKNGAGIKKTNEGGFAVLDGIEIHGPDDVASHIEKYLLPRLNEKIAGFDEKELIQTRLNYESMTQAIFGRDILKAGYGVLTFPGLHYGDYGYEPYFTAYMLYPELIEKVFALQADFAILFNKATLKAFARADLPKYCRLDHDMADSRSLLCSMKSLERMWLPHFIRSIKSAVDADYTLLWHCDGNLSELVPYLLDSGVNGFQGFQYEDGMDYVKICKMKPKRGGELVVQAGVSVTRTLPFGKPADVAREMRFLVENGTPHMFLAMSSSCVPGTPYENIKTCVDGFNYYRLNGKIQ